MIATTLEPPMPVHWLTPAFLRLSVAFSKNLCFTCKYIITRGGYLDRRTCVKLLYQCFSPHAHDGRGLENVDEQRSRDSMKRQSTSLSVAQTVRSREQTRRRRGKIHCVPFLSAFLLSCGWRTGLPLRVRMKP